MEQMPQEKLPAKTPRALVLLAAGVAYLALVASTFIFGIDLAADRIMQYVLHGMIVISVFAWLFFVEMVYRTEADRANGRMALIFAALFTVPVLIGRSIGLAAVSFDALNPPDGVFNFYGSVSVSRTIEVSSWTTLFPLSMVFLAKVFFHKRNRALLAWTCVLSAVCCFIAFLSVVSTASVFLWIGVLGWGVLFLLVVIIYLCCEARDKKEAVL
jgi:hypothetical protein